MFHGESRFQQAAVIKLRSNGYFCFSVPNGVKLYGKQGNIARNEGMLAGVSDLIVLLTCYPVFVEFKNPNGRGRQNPDQKKFERNVKKLGYRYVVWDSMDHVDQFIDNYKDYKGYTL